jgi:UDP-N-acetylmuramate--alanine ligase
VIGAAGAGASAAALLAQSVGAIVTACDAGAPSPYTAALQARGMVVLTSHDPGHVASATGALVDRLAVSKALTAIDPEHPELVAARTLDVPVEAWQQLVADVAATTGQTLVAVAGTHGKSTTTGWLIHVLAQAGRDPNGFVGALLAAEDPAGPASTARLGRGDVFVVEADEYAGNFAPYRPSVAVLLNAEWDHPDVFADEAAVLAAFDVWIRTMAPGPAGPPTLIVNVADPGARHVADGLDDWPGTRVRVALEPAEDRRDGTLPGDPERDLDGAEVLGRLVTSASGQDTLEVRGSLTGELRLQMPLAGRHNAADALCVAAAAAVLGVPAASIESAVGSFAGVGRRMEVKGEPGGVVVIDDYGHHPSAIRATLAAVRGAYPGRPVWAVYEPLTFHRTAAMLDAFADVLSQADHAVIADIWAGRDRDQTVVSAADLAAAISARAPIPALATGSPEATADRLVDLVRPGDVVLVMGGGRSYVIAERLVERLAARV